MPKENQSLKTKIPKDMRLQANEFLNSRSNANNLVDIISHLKRCKKENQSTVSSILTLEVIFTELLKRGDMNVEHTPTTDNNPEVIYSKWLSQCFEESLNLLLDIIEESKGSDGIQSLQTAMKLLITENEHPMQTNKNEKQFPKNRLQNILKSLVNTNKSQISHIARFKEYTQYLDIVYQSWESIALFPISEIVQKEIVALNFLDLINVVPVTKDLYDNKKILCSFKESEKPCYEYKSLRKIINRVWKNLLMNSNGMPNSVHRQMLIILLERILPHLEKPILLTDFLMDSLDCGGAVSLLALQGLFTLIQKHNITYPNIYEKLYSMFEPNIFHTKYKARLFYLSDIFLSSTHLPEGLVAAFLKRFARLCLIAPPQDILIMLYFIGNLMIRHPSLKELISAKAPIVVSQDPFNIEEEDPLKSRALESSLWEIILLQKHALPSIATAAKFISQPFPTTEWDLSSVLDFNDNEIFNLELEKNCKQYPLVYERPQTLALVNNDSVSKYFKLF